MSFWIDLKDYTTNNSINFGDTSRGGVKVKRHLMQPFLKGPVPLSWLIQASHLGKSSLMVGLVLWYMDGMRHQRTFRMGRGEIAKLLGVSRSTVLRGVKRLESNHLIFVLRESGRKLIITMNRNSGAHYK